MGASSRHLPAAAAAVDGNNNSSNSSIGWNLSILGLVEMQSFDRQRQQHWQHTAVARARPSLSYVSWIALPGS